PGRPSIRGPGPHHEPIPCRLMAGSWLDQITQDGSVLGSSWQRRLRSTGQTVFGLYGIADLPHEPGRSIRVVFPLPNGSLTVFLRPENISDGGLRLLSDGSPTRPRSSGRQ
ncbi:MAG: hypothetical protein ACRDVL_08305, partial [Acidimicrobiia bacterium]